MTRNSTRTPAATPDMSDIELDEFKSSATESSSTDTDLRGLDKTIEMDNQLSLEELRDSLNSQVSKSIDDPDFLKFTADSSFMEEHVLVMVHNSSDPNAEKIVEVFNNGTPQRFIRGQWVMCRRKYVEVLARAKEFSVLTPEITDGNGDRTTSIDLKHGLRYPFEMKDRNRIGMAWLDSVLRQP